MLPDKLHIVLRQRPSNEACSEYREGQAGVCSRWRPSSACDPPLDAWMWGVID